MFRSEPIVDIQICDPRLKEWGFPHKGSKYSCATDVHACLDQPITLAIGAPPVRISVGFKCFFRDTMWCGVLCARSGLGHKGLIMGNQIGLIDPDYTGIIEVSLCFRYIIKNQEEQVTIKPGDRIAQLFFVPYGTLNILSENDIPRPIDSDRVNRGFGSSGI